jgi:hypothetical protein
MGNNEGRNTEYKYWGVNASSNAVFAVNRQSAPSSCDRHRSGPFAITGGVEFTGSGSGREQSITEFGIAGDALDS